MAKPTYLQYAKKNFSGLLLKKILKNLDPDIRDEPCGVDTRHQFIYNSFSWYNSREGVSYWSKKADEIEAKERKG